MQYDILFSYLYLFIITNKFIVNSKWNSENTLINMHTNLCGNMKIDFFFLLFYIKIGGEG